MTRGEGRTLRRARQGEIMDGFEESRDAHLANWFRAGSVARHRLTVPSNWRLATSLTSVSLFSHHSRRFSTYHRWAGPGSVLAT